MIFSYHDRIEHPVVDDGVHGDGDGVPREDFLGRDVEADRPQINCLVVVDAREDEEYSRALGAPSPQSPETENDRSFVFLDNLSKLYLCEAFYKSIDLDAETQRQGQGEEHHQERDQRQEQGAASGTPGIR